MSTSALLFLHCHTALHCGSGSAVGSIDLPVQRERHTGWPLIPAATIKGVLRDRARLSVRNGGATDLAEADQNKEIEVAFGPSMKRNAASEHAGAIAFTDAYPLLFPVRSLKGLFAWVTCPSALGRFLRDRKTTGQPNENFAHVISTLPQGQALVEPGSQLLLDETNLVLEEFDFTASPNEPLAALSEFLTATLDLPALEARLAVLSDDDFTHFVINATEIQAHIALEYETKTAKGGALFYTEYVPPETVFVSLILAEDRYTKAITKKAGELLGDVQGWIGSTSLIQLGGNATTGKGLCRPIIQLGA